MHIDQHFDEADDGPLAYPHKGMLFEPTYEEEMWNRIMFHLAPAG